MKSLMLTENPRLSKRYFIPNFISGLREELQLTLRMHKPLTLNHAFVLHLWQKQYVEVIDRHRSVGYQSYPAYAEKYIIHRPVPEFLSTHTNLFMKSTIS